MNGKLWAAISLSSIRDGKFTRAMLHTTQESAEETASRVNQLDAGDAMIVVPYFAPTPETTEVEA